MSTCQGHGKVNLGAIETAGLLRCGPQRPNLNGIRPADNARSGRRRAGVQHGYANAVDVRRSGSSATRRATHRGPRASARPVDDEDLRLSSGNSGDRDRVEEFNVFERAVEKPNGTDTLLGRYKRPDPRMRAVALRFGLTRVESAALG